MSFGRGRPPVGVTGLPTNPDTLAGAASIGADGYSGMVPAGQPIQTDPDAGVSQRLGHQLVQTTPQHGTDLAPIPGVVDRPLFGGLRSMPAYDTLRDGPAYDGAHVVLRGRRSVMVLHPAEEVSPAGGDASSVPSLRVPPVSDPLGRACANARAVAAAKAAG